MRFAGRLLIPSTALLWGLQFAFLSPTLGLLLASLYSATPAQIGWSMSIYSASAFVASLVVPGWADRRRDYLTPMLGCAILTILLMTALWFSGTLTMAVAALVVMGGPAGVGGSLFFAHLRDSGASRADVMNTRAILSFA